MKKIWILLAACCVILSGCGREATEATEEIIEEMEEKEEFINGFENASLNYEKFNSYASENGLGDSLVYIEGKVISQANIKDDVLSLAIVVEQHDGNRWGVAVPCDSAIDEINDRNVRIFGTYMGFSDLMNLPGLAVYINNSENADKAKIELQEDKEYKMVWNFYDDYFKYQLEDTQESGNGEQKGEEIDIVLKKEYEVGGKNVTIGLTEIGGVYSVTIFGNANTEEKASIMLATFISDIKKTNFEEYSITVNMGELFVAYMKKEEGDTLMGLNRDGSHAITAPDWIATDISMSDEEFNNYVDEINSALSDFLESAKDF